MWFGSVSVVVRMCVWHGSDMSQMCVVECCGSVVRGMVQMWFRIGSVVVQVCVCVCVQVCVVQCCGSVVRGMVQMWLSIGSVVCG